jgi:ubiquitin C-terminal hydrolase
LTEFVLRPFSDISEIKQDSLFMHYCRLIKKLWLTKSKYVIPKELVFKVVQLYSIFETSSQNDCAEFLTSVLNRFHEELMLAQTGKDISNEYINYDTHEEYLKNNSTFIAENFNGFKSTQVICHCENILSRSNDPFFIINLPQIKNRSRSVLLDDCFKKYLSLKKTNAKDKILCGKCGSNTVSYEKTDILHLPNIVIIQLKSNPLLQASENLYNWEFPQSLNLENYVSNGSKNSQSFNYQLIAVSNYSGNSHSGHYYAYAQNFLNNNWYRFDDRNVQKMSLNQLVTPQAYLLVYAKDKGETGPNFLDNDDSMETEEMVAEKGASNFVQYIFQKITSN